MEVTLVSEDSDLRKLCAEVIPEITQDHPCSFSACSAQALGKTPADLYILDFEPNFSLPADIHWNFTNVVALVHRRDIAEMKRALGFEATMVLKPATRATLSALLSFAISHHSTASLRDDRDQIFQRLIEANLKLQEYDQNRTTFLTKIVHDLRAPLTALSGYCGLLLSEPLGPLNDNQKEVVRRMHYSAKRLVRMASAMLQLSVDRQNKRRPDLQKGDIQERLDQALYEIAPFVEDKRITIESTLAPSGDGLYFEPAQIDQVLVNILDNACKYTPRNGSIEIRGYPFFWERRTGTGKVGSLARERRASDTREPNSYRVDIRNSGSALEAEHLERIFDEYTSCSDGRDRSAGGLGLAICRMIIDQHEGRVWAENTDKGPVFSFVLPMHRFGSATKLTSQMSVGPGGQKRETA